MKPKNQAPIEPALASELSRRTLLKTGILGLSSLALGPSLVWNTALGEAGRDPREYVSLFTGRVGQDSLDVTTLSRDADEARSLGERVSEWVRSTFFIPDARIGWYPFATRAAIRLARFMQSSHASAECCAVAI